MAQDISDDAALSPAQHSSATNRPEHLTAAISPSSAESARLGSTPKSHHELHSVKDSSSQTGVNRPTASTVARRRPTIADVAKLAQTSRGTVSFVINNKPGVAESTRQRVLAAMAELQWIPDRTARALSRSQTGTIGFILHRESTAMSHDPFFAPFISALGSQLEGADRDLAIRFVSDPQTELTTYRRMIEMRQVDGFILADVKRADPRIPLLAEYRFPAVSLDPIYETEILTAITEFEEPGVTATVKHLVNLGHRNIAFISGPEEYVHIQQRYQAWRDVLRTHGIALGPVIMSVADGHDGSTAMTKLIESKNAALPTAIVCANDLIAATAMRRAITHGIRVPQDMSFVGYGNFPLAASLNPALTTVHADPISRGVAAAQGITGLIDGTAPSAKRAQLVTSSAVIRDSTGPAPA